MKNKEIEIEKVKFEDSLIATSSTWKSFILTHPHTTLTWH